METAETENARVTSSVSSADSLRDAYARWRETKRRYLELKQRLEENDIHIRALRKELVQGQERRAKIVSDCMDRILNPSELVTFDAELQAVQDRKTEAEKVEATTRAEFEQAETEYSAARKAAELARERFCFEEAATIETKIQEDKALRKRLVEAFAVISAAVDPELPTTGAPNWVWFIRELFPEPEDADLAEPVARFKREHITPLIGE
ncbi:MAG: hypothetical protein Q7J84_13925 [Sulfuricaulis sp.]|nr:hypothetical protein [Sulfuricaulis sp.]